MTAPELATKLNGCVDISDELIKEAKDSGLVIVYGYSDDNIEIEGAIREEVGAYGGGVVYFANGDILLDCDEACDHCSVEKDKEKAKTVAGLWINEGGDSDASWTMKAGEGINAYRFHMREEEDSEELFCKGLVFSIEDIK